MEREGEMEREGGRDGRMDGREGSEWEEQGERRKKERSIFWVNNTIFGFVISLAKGAEEPRHLLLPQLLLLYHEA